MKNTRLRATTIYLAIDSRVHHRLLPMGWAKGQKRNSGRNQQDVLFQKEQSDRYSKTAFIKHIQKYVGDELWRVEPSEGHLTYTGKPEVTEMSETRLATFQREIADNE